MVRPDAHQNGKGLAIGDQRPVEDRTAAARGASGSIFTIGHSNHSVREFAGLLKEYAIEVLVDTRSHPYSRHAPHFNARGIRLTLAGCGIGYLFLGRELGGRPDGEEFYDAEGRVDYALVERSQPFLDGIHRLEKEIQTRRVALLCSEEDPARCHRGLLIGRVLGEKRITVRHIRGDGSVQTEGEADQPVLFPEAEVRPRKSIRSVLRRRRPPSSSGR